MRYLFLLFMISANVIFSQVSSKRNTLLTNTKISNTINSNETAFTSITNTQLSIAPPPTIGELPPLEMVSSILNENTSIDDIKKKFTSNNTAYKGDITFYPTSDALGIWWRFYTQTTSLFNIPAVSEEILVIEEDGTALWLQDVKTTSTVQSQSHRSLQVSAFDLFGHLFYVFHYANQDPKTQSIRNKQGFFVRILSDKGYMQMSKSPNFEPEKSIYWRRFPKRRQ